MDSCRPDSAFASQRLVIKVGTRLLAHSTGRLNPDYIESLVNQVAGLHRQGKEVILVSSGAIGAGMGRLQMERRPGSIPEKQAAAAVGQGLLVQIYEKLFSEHGVTVAQVLVTRTDLVSRRRYINARNTIYCLLKWGVVPIINENDTVSVEEIKFGDNDQLSALVAGLIDARLLIILTSIDGFYSGNPRKDPNARLIPVVNEITPRLKSWAGLSNDDLATGGMVTKLQAAEIATNSGVGVYIADGTAPDILNRIISGEQVGTYFLPRKRYLSHRKRWIAYGQVVKGSVTVDNGAKRALCRQGKSLLPVGVISVDGSFKTGDLVKVLDLEGRELGRGLTNFSSTELSRIKTHASGEIPAILGGADEPEEVIHRDNLVIYGYGSERRGQDASRGY